MPPATITVTSSHRTTRTATQPVGGRRTVTNSIPQYSGGCQRRSRPVVTVHAASVYCRRTGHAQAKPVDNVGERYPQCPHSMRRITVDNLCITLWITLTDRVRTRIECGVDAGYIRPISPSAPFVANNIRHPAVQSSNLPPRNHQTIITQDCGDHPIVLTVSATIDTTRLSLTCLLVNTRLNAGLFTSKHRLPTRYPSVEYYVKLMVLYRG